MIQKLWTILKIPVLVTLGVVALVAGLNVIDHFLPDKKIGDVELQIDPQGYTKIDWRLLREMDYKTGDATASLKNLDGQQIRIPGFIVPLEDDQSQITEFLLVPSPQACIHVPPPPPNQMLYVKMKTPISFEWGYRAYWVMGRLHLKKVDSPYGLVSFEMEGEGVKVYKKYEDEL